MNNKSHIVFDVVCDNHLVIFYPLPYFELEAINRGIQTAQESIPNATKFQDLTFHWITLEEILDREFSVNFLSAFDYRIFLQNAKKLVGNLIGDQDRSTDYQYPDYAVMVCDNQKHLELSNELLLMG